uniref:Bowman-Birk serine protease inhibitors family domain-containing protein n=1 Tax=Leersia perrieri TaxID=77586 RepID=A0A0D9WP59_9ORYZ
MKNNTRMPVFILLLAVGSLAIVVHGGRTHGMEAVNSLREEKASADSVQLDFDPITICSPSNFCIPQPWSECYRCIVKPYDNPPFQKIDDCKRNCPVPPTTVSPAHA